MTTRQKPAGSWHLRRIEPGDDAAIASIIREVMTSYGACGAGFAITDPEVDAMFVAYQERRSRFLVLADGDRVIGCGGYARLKGGGPDVCELRKMYFLPGARGRGWGRTMLDRLLSDAREDGYLYCYVETLERMTEARRLYESAGFEPLDSPRGQTGHHGCDRWYLLEL
jgi:putative acetyltransferase